LKSVFSILAAAATAALAQLPPRAQPVDAYLRPDAPNDFFQRGRNLHDSAQSAEGVSARFSLYDRASQILTEYLSLFPDHANAEAAWWYLGNSHYQCGRIDDAKRCFHTLINRHPRGKWSAAAAYTLAADHYNKREYALAASMFERFANGSERPGDAARGHYHAGNCHRLTGREREARAAFNKVLQDPAAGTFAPQARIALGHLATKVGRDDEALRWFEEVLALPHPAEIRCEAVLHAGLAAAKLGRIADSDRHLALVMRYPDMHAFHSAAQTALMSNRFERGEYREVLEWFRKPGIKAEGADQAARVMLAARASMRLKRPKDALEWFREVEKLVPSESDAAFDAAYYRLLCFYQIEGHHVPEQVDAFLQLHGKARANDPRLHTALMMKAESLFAEKKMEEAAKAYLKVDDTKIAAANRPGLLFQRGWCLVEAGDAIGAIRSLGRFIDEFPKDERLPVALAKRAKAHEANGDPARAVADYDRILATKDDELVSHAWLESARLQRGEGAIADMILRYRGLLQQVGDLSDKIRAEANYWIGWGLVKTNAAADAVTYLETARTTRPDAYRRHAGILLALGFFAAQDHERLADEIRLAVEHRYVSEIPTQALQWCGIQAYNAGDHATAVICLTQASTPEDPRATPKEVWRYLAKSRLETGDAAGALDAVAHTLAVEDNAAWKADGLLDRGRALMRLGRHDESRKAVEDALELRPQGRTSAGLRVLAGDLEMLGGNFKKAAAEYLVVVQFIDDKDFKPLALHKLAGALERQGDADGSANSRRQLTEEFPDWNPPKEG